ncbi:MAG: hypothetical protein WCL71_01835 [Deltaproteobacteria bacterium]
MANRVKEFFKMLTAPAVSVNLLNENVRGKDSFYARITEEFCREAMRRHSKFPLIRQLQYGVALCPLPDSHELYFMSVEAAARRNFKKADRNGYHVERICYNDFLGDIKAIRTSTDVRQGAMSADFLQADIKPCANPSPQTRSHDYPYFGVLKDEKLVAYAGLLVAGELAMVEHIYGHAGYQADGVVPMLIIGMVKYIKTYYPDVKYYGYGSYFGASETMRRFKRKFCFTPHRVNWILG